MQGNNEALAIPRLYEFVTLTPSSNIIQQYIILRMRRHLLTIGSFPSSAALKSAAAASTMCGLPL